MSDLPTSREADRCLEREPQPRELLFGNGRDFNTLFESAPLGIGICELDGTIRHANPALAAFLGYRVGGLVGRTVPDISHPDDQQQDEALMGELLEGRRQSFQMIKRYRHANGHIVYGELSVTLIRDEKGRPKYGLGMVWDLTERVLVEEKNAQ